MDLRILLGNYVLTVSIACWISAQAIKVLITFFTTKKIEWERFVGAGGMPSSHSATVCGMTISVARHSGFNSVFFAISFVMAFVVMYDAMGVRRAAGEQAKKINYLMSKDSGTSVKKTAGSESESKSNGNASDETEENHDISEDEQLKEFLGHTPAQVLAGALLGITIAMLIPN